MRRATPSPVATWLGKGNDPRYTPTTTFETFPFPAGLTPAGTAGATEILESGAVLPPIASDRRAEAIRIAEAAHRLNELRERWLNPPEWVDRIPEVVPGYLVALRPALARPVRMVRSGGGLRKRGGRRCRARLKADL